MSHEEEAVSAVQQDLRGVYQEPITSEVTQHIQGAIEESTNFTHQIPVDDGKVDHRLGEESLSNARPSTSQVLPANGVAQPNPFRAIVEDVEDGSDRVDPISPLQLGAAPLHTQSVAAPHISNEASFPSTPPTPQRPLLGSPFMTPTEIIHRGPYVPHVQTAKAAAPDDATAKWVRDQAACAMGGSGTAFTGGAIRGASWKAARDIQRKLARYGEACEDYIQEIGLLTNVLYMTARELHQVDRLLDRMRRERLLLEKRYLPRFVADKRLRSGDPVPEDEPQSEVSAPSPSSDRMREFVLEYSVYPEWLDNGQSQPESDSSTEGSEYYLDGQQPSGDSDKGKGRAYDDDDADSDEDDDNEEDDEDDSPRYTFI